MKGRNIHMEKLLQYFLLFGVTLVVAGTVTACSLNTDSEIKNAASQVEVDVNQNEQDYVKQQEQLEVEVNNELKNIEQELEKNNIQEIKTERLEYELDQYWKKYNEVLAPFIERGLTFEEFTEIYKFFRVGNEDVFSADDAYQSTYNEVARRYSAEPVDDIGFEGNITIKEDGTYEYSEKFLTNLKKRPYFEGATDKEIKVFMNDFLDFFGSFEGDLDAEMMDILLDSFDDGNLHQENITIKESQTGKTQPSNPNKNTGSTNNNNSGSTSNNGSTGNNSSTGNNNQSSGTTNKEAVNHAFEGWDLGPTVSEGKTDIDLNIH